ncbi:MAG: hypothetical protein JST30_00825 [Armatimonadetes bacterium]|nr:hypothetical protein [Armatimonadota bacterium]
MKLNLLPTHVSKEGQSKVAWVASGLMVVGAIAVGAYAMFWSNQELTAAKDRAAKYKTNYDTAVATAKKADDIMAGSVVIDRNLKLANAMLKHNTVYPDLYRDVLSYVPTFFRVTDVTATSLGPGLCTVSLTGVIQTYQQYADIMLAMLRIPGATNVTRAGFADVRPVVPALNDGDQRGLPVRPGESNLPSDPMARLEEMIARAESAPRGFVGAEGFGVPDATRKGAMPDWSVITLVVTINRDIQTPDPEATLRAQGGASNSPAPGGGGGPGNTTPTPSGPAPGPAGPNNRRGVGGDNAD